MTSSVLDKIYHSTFSFVYHNSQTLKDVLPVKLLGSILLIQLSLNKSFQPPSSVFLQVRQFRLNI
jgi:hypothetical protein